MKLTFFVVAIFLLSSLLGMSTAVAKESTKGARILRTLLEHVATRRTLSCKCNFDIAGKFKEKSFNFSGTSKVAFDLRNRSREQIGIEADSSIAGIPIRAVVNSRGLDVRFFADISGQAPMGYKIDFANLGRTGNNSNSSASTDSSLSKHKIAKIYRNTVKEARKALSPEGRIVLIEEALTRTTKYTTVKYVAPNCLRFIPKKGPKIVSELYYDRDTQVVNSLLVHDSHSKVTTKLVFSNWQIDGPISFPEEPRGVSCRNFNQQAIGKILGTVIGLFSEKSSSQTINYGKRPASYIENRLKSLDSPEFKMKIREAEESAARN